MAPLGLAWSIKSSWPRIAVGTSMGVWLIKKPAGQCGDLAGLWEDLVSAEGEVFPDLSREEPSGRQMVRPDVLPLHSPPGVSPQLSYTCHLYHSPGSWQLGSYTLDKAETSSLCPRSGIHLPTRASPRYSPHLQPPQTGCLHRMAPFILPCSRLERRPASLPSRRRARHNIELQAYGSLFTALTAGVQWR